MSMPSLPLKNQLTLRLDDVQATIASLVEAPKHQKRGRSKTKRRGAHDRQDSSVPRRGKSSSKGNSTRATQPNACNYEHCMRPITHKTEDCLFPNLTAKIGADPWRSPERCASDRFGYIAAVSTTVIVTSRHDQCPVNTTVGTKSTDTVAVAAKSDGRSDTTRQHHLSKVTLLAHHQCLYIVVAKHPKHRPQYLDSRRCETKHNSSFCRFLAYYQSAVIDISSCTTRFPSARVRIPAYPERRQRRTSTHYRLHSGHTLYRSNFHPEPCKVMI